MNRLSRRKFLKSLVIGVGALTVAGCSTDSGKTPTLQLLKIKPTDPPAPTNSPIPPPPTSAPTLTGSPRPTPTISSTSTSAPKNLDLVVVKNGEPELMVKKAIDALGGMAKFVRPGAKVIIKPNICVAYHTYEYAATTNPWVVGALVKLCIEAGAASVRVMDQPFGGTPQEAFSKSGIEAQVKAAGGEMVVMAGHKYIPVAIPKGVDLKTVTIYDEFQKMDVLINVPIIKHHNLTRLTLGMKNLMGIVGDRPGIHRNIYQRLPDLTSLLYPTLTVIDGVRMLMNHGPTGGSLDDVKKVDTIIVGKDIVAADSYAATVYGIKPDELQFIKAAVAMKLGRSDLQNLKIEEISLAA